MARLNAAEMEDLEQAEHPLRPERWFTLNTSGPDPLPRRCGCDTCITVAPLGPRC